jgi:hypothetical protein
MGPTARDSETGRHVGKKAIRRSEEVIPLEIRGYDPATLRPTVEDGSRDYIHEAQVSFMITGIDDWFWTAYSFVDIYFKGDGNTESVDHYSQTNPQTPPMDPHSCGNYEADKPIWNPRHYFLRCLSCRMEQVKQEWNNVIYQLFQHIDPCVCTFPNQIFANPPFYQPATNAVQDIFLHKRRR